MVNKIISVITEEPISLGKSNLDSMKVYKKIQAWRVMLHPTSVPSKTLRGCFSPSVRCLGKNIQKTKKIFIIMLIMDTGMFTTAKVKESIMINWSEPRKTILLILSLWKVPVVYALCSSYPPPEKWNYSLWECLQCIAHLTLQWMRQRINKRT